MTITIEKEDSKKNKLDVKTIIQNNIKLIKRTVHFYDTQSWQSQNVYQFKRNNMDNARWTAWWPTASC